MTTVLESVSQGLADVTAAVGAGVVRVAARRRLAASGAIWSAEGMIVTANHVVRQEEGIEVGLADGRMVKARLVGRDPTTDLAVLQAEGSDLSAPTWRDPAAPSMAVGHLVLALGRPGQSVQATLGIISALSDGPWRTPGGGQLDRYLQTDVVMYPGFSGGPLVDVQGVVLGINSSALLRGVSLTVPSATVRGVVETLISHGKMRRGYLGVNTQPVRLPADLRDRVGQEAGLLVVAVEDGSPAAAGGLLLGDTIVALDGNPVQSYDDLIALLGGDRVGAAAAVSVIRGGQPQTISLTIGERA